MESFISQAIFTAMERAAAVGLAVALAVLCLYWTYGYIRRRSKRG